MNEAAFAFSSGLIVVSLIVLGGEHHASLLRGLRAHEQRIDRSLRFLRSPLAPRQVVLLEFGFLVAGSAMAFFAPSYSGLAVIVVGCSAAPRFALRRACSARAEKINVQVEPMLGAIARALVAAPSLGEALASARTVVESPLADELAEMLEEFRLGTNLELALTHLSERVPSENLRIAVLTLKLGQKSGGKLAGILETTAATMREMERLEGVLRTKTAEGKAQTFVIALMPVGLVGAMHVMMPTYFAPLETSFIGNMIVSVVLCLWMGAIVLARRILAVDL